MESEIITCWRDDWLVGPSYNVTRDEWNCAEHYPKCDCPSLLADTDIAGTGVIVAFTATASLTLVATVACLLLSRSRGERTFNPIDRFFRAHICEPVQTLLGEKRADLWALVLYDMVICLSDQQLVTGTAFLVACLRKIADASITVYHVETVADLAWFSSNTHLLSLLVVGYFDISAKPNAESRGRRQFMAKLPSLLRVVLMCIMAGMLLYVTYISAYLDWYEVWNCPAACTIPYEKGGEPMQWAIANFVLILYSYPLSMFTLWQAGRRAWVSKWRHHLIDKSSLEAPGHTVPWGKDRGWLYRITKGSFLCVWYLLSSDLETVLEQMAWHAIGYYGLFTARVSGQDLMTESERDEENGFGFGQLVPIFLLLLPVVQFFESLAVDAKISSAHSSNPPSNTDEYKYDRELSLNSMEK
ncbi:hypothetical protein AAE478_007444 [Parahypoxylon ruwenzoriense]